jgi:lysozyme family protein
MSRFDECMKFILKEEGGFVDDKADHGGATNHGITERTDDAWDQAHGLPAHSVRDISDEEVADIYREEYWDACQCDNLPPRLDLAVFDAAIQHSAGRAIKWLQLAAGVPTDGHCGPKTIYAVQAFAASHRVNELINTYMDTRNAFYAGIIARDPTQKRFAHGWQNRMDALDDALKAL